jgi:hypothetical protein
MGKIENEYDFGSITALLLLIAIAILFIAFGNNEN